jgi:MFS superfamily sulfate permease-like transporter
VPLADGDVGRYAILAATAAIMIASQLGKVSGASVKGDEFLDQMRSFIAGIGSAHWPRVALALSVLVVLLALAWLPPRIPARSSPYWVAG